MFMLLPVMAIGQKQFRKEFPIGNANDLSLYFKWPDQVTVKYHDKNTVLIEGTVSINNGKYDDAFSVDSKTEGSTLAITSEVQGMDTLEHITVITERNGDDEVIYKSKNGNTYISHHDGDHVSTGVIMDIFITVYLPANIPAVVEAKFGLIEVKETRGPLMVNSKFGGVDITIDESEKLELKAATAFGDIFTDLKVDFRGNGELNKTGGWHRISTTFAGGGKIVDVESKFGNVYLRRK